MKRCYYEILDVDRKAQSAEIKKAYRKMALKYHPDKNPDQETKHLFVQINEAYNVLSDPNERTWYDNNREKVLFNKEQMSKEDLEQYSFGFNIWAYFTMNCFEGYEDNAQGFYAVYRDVFEKIKAEEAKAYNSRDDIEEEFKKYEGFGVSDTPEEKMLKFYEDWDNFTTYKTFVWSEEYNTREAYNRWERREMEKQNKKQRQGEKKTYIKTIKDLIAYVRKRDPRFRQYQMKLKEQEERKLQEKIQREKRKKQQKQQMKEIKQKMQEERFKEVEQYFKQQQQTTGVGKNQKHEEQEQFISEFYCQICNKEFKSENQLRNHEKSKQHKQMVKSIQKEVMLKEELLEKAEQIVEKAQEKPQETVEEPQPSKKKNKKKKKKQQQVAQEDNEQEEKVEQPPKKVEAPKKETKPEPKPQPKQVSPPSESDSDDDDAFMNAMLNNKKKAPPKQMIFKEEPQPKQNNKKQPVPPLAEDSDSQDEEGQKADPKLNKAKLKKQKKAEQQKAGKTSAMKCNICNESFTSKTKLFDHIKKTGHASAK